MLEDAGLITIEEGYAGKKSARTWVTLTKTGHAARAQQAATSSA